jgi:signal transduction histidine kinase
MQERVREQGGTLEIQSDETGTAIEVNMPLRRVPQAADAQAPINAD